MRTRIIGLKIGWTNSRAPNTTAMPASFKAKVSPRSQSLKTVSCLLAVYGALTELGARARVGASAEVLSGFCG